MILLTAKEMQAVDAFAIETLGIPSRLLMENAGRQVAQAALHEYGQMAKKGVLVVCGPGNNGGDGFVAARYLHQAGVAVKIVCLCTRDTYREDSLANLQLVQNLPISFYTDETALTDLRHILQECGLVLDAIFGTGLKREVAGWFHQAICAINEAKRPVVAVDIPSGLSADTGMPLGVAVQARLTVTMQYAKVGLFTGEGPEYCGKVQVVDIGIPEEALAAVSSRHVLLTRLEVQKLLQPRPVTGHKGTFGHVLLLAGSRGKYGAGLLACRGALRSGAGLVTLACPAEMQPVLAQSLLEAMSVQLHEDLKCEQAWQVVLEACAKKRAVAVGPGFGLSIERRGLMRQVIRELHLPLVVDADALSATAEDLNCLVQAKGPRILTPHVGEMARLFSLSVSEVQANRIAVARSFAEKTGCFVVLKGPGTTVASPDGFVAINSTGNAGMATGGMGDVLTGVLAGLLVQGYGPWEACLIGVFAHGRAGDRLEAFRGPFGFLASELADELPKVWQELLKGKG
jgi:NAD(P)H-hydrate epimerase